MLKDIYEFFSHLFDTQGWVARWVCGRWTPALGWTYIISSLVIGIAYFTIPFILFRFISKRKDILPFNRIFWLFIIFIFSCGITHFSDAAMFWYPAYRFSAASLFITAIVSSFAVISLFKVIPLALSLKSPLQLEEIIRQRTEDLANKNDELVKLNQQLLDANKKTEELLRQKDEFLDIASHELKTPITSLKVSIQMMEDFTRKQVQPANIHFLATKADKQINKLTSLVETLLDITKIQAGKLQLNTSCFSIVEAMNEWTEQAQLYSDKHTILLEETNKDYKIEADKNRLEQVVVNLLSNAVKYSPDNKKIVVKIDTEKEKSFLKVSVTDNGIGICEKEIPFVFDRFFRSKNGQTFSGLGLGLYISSQIIKQHGGNIYVNSNVSKGSCFWFTLPLEKQHPELLEL